MATTIEELEQRREQARLGGGIARIEAQHAKGRLTARERLAGIGYGLLRMVAPDRLPQDARPLRRNPSSGVGGSVESRVINFGLREWAKGTRARLGPR